MRDSLVSLVCFHSAPQPEQSTPSITESFSGRVFSKSRVGVRRRIQRRIYVVMDEEVNWGAAKRRCADKPPVTLWFFPDTSHIHTYIHT